ncbi:uncharacterized protein H6S33_007040 [Morchella sextelata]|uniref:uncharacterized protein n=1 Tax=Morchella sextelata TaxID=1174677 RepID=UPI001D0599BB|nr:uncharacterized protein H6S33_007040 [Morchella sextelata]KAH0604009.1 hypothetical protein H6S33_007040 [Morchella sextelata]
MDPAPFDFDDDEKISSRAIKAQGKVVPDRALLRANHSQIDRDCCIVGSLGDPRISGRFYCRLAGCPDSDVPLTSLPALKNHEQEHLVPKSQDTELSQMFKTSLTVDQHSEKKYVKNPEFEERLAEFEKALAEPVKVPAEPRQTQDNDSVAAVKRSNLGPGPYHCTSEGCRILDKPFKYLSKLRDHQREHLPPAFPCPECGQKFKQSRILQKHLDRVHKSSQNQRGAGDAPRCGTTLDVTYADLDLTSHMTTLTIQTLQNQTYQLYGGLDTDVLFPPDVFVNSDWVDIHPGLIRCPVLYHTSSEGVGGSGFEDLFPDGTTEAGATSGGDLYV